MSQKRCTLTKKTQIYEQRSIGCIDSLNVIYHIRYPICHMRYCHLSDIRYETKQNSNLCKSERTVKTSFPQYWQKCIRELENAAQRYLLVGSAFSPQRERKKFRKYVYNQCANLIYTL